MKEEAARLLWNNLIISLGIGIIILFFKYIWLYLWGKKASASPLDPKKIIVVNNPFECQEAVLTLYRKVAKYRVLGFDCEWLTTQNGRYPVALLQLASNDGYCVLIRLCKFGDCYIPPALQALLEDSSILKVGIVPSDDADYLFKDYGVIVRGCLDLRHLVVMFGGMPLGGLAGLAYNVLGVIMDKSWVIRCSNWEAEELTTRQLNYAADDALVAVKIFNNIVHGQLKFSRFSVSRWFRKLQQYLKGRTYSYSVVPSFVYDYVDIKFNKRAGNSNNAALYNPESANSVSHMVKQKPVKVLKPVTRAFCTRQSPLYHNCFMQAPDGAVLCTCDRKKAIWYVSKKLAELISEEPLTVRLKFEPSGRAVGTVGQYYVQTKSNCCVVCGKVDNCIRKNVVPHEYRKHFPKIMKDHVSHDILLLCLPCHLRSNAYDLTFKKKLAELCSAPFCQGGNAKYFENRELCAVRAAAKALVRQSEKIPLERKEILKNIVQDYYGASELSDDLLQDALKLKTNAPNKDYDPHGTKVVQYFSEESNGGLVKLEQMWREHFLQTMNPQYMPNLWSVTHTQDRLTIRASENRVLPDDLCVAGMKDCVPLLDLAKGT